MQTKISVITICRNAAATVATTIQSVAWQDYAAYEHVIVDGLSNDETPGIIERLSHRSLRVIREPDTGIYNAMNKGLRLSTGNVLLFLNADDYFSSPYVLSRVASAFAERPEIQMLYGDFIWDSGVKQLARCQPDRISRRFFTLDKHINHQTLFCRRGAFDKVGLFDESFRVAADLDWEERAFLVEGLPYYHLPLFVCVSYAGGYSSVAKAVLLNERAVIRRRYLSRGERLNQFAHLLLAHLLQPLKTGGFIPSSFLLRSLSRQRSARHEE
jgi:glycosyltransferase involved in cell wall biosynthesis